MKGLIATFMICFMSICIANDFDRSNQFLLIGSHSTLPLQIVPLRRSPASNAIEIRIVFPKEYALERSSPIRSQLRLIGFPLGVKTRSSGLPALKESPNGQTVRVIVDNEPHFSLTLGAEGSEDANLDVYRKRLNFKLPNDLTQGEHVLRVYPVFSYGESIKLPNNFDVSTFYKGSRKPVIRQDLSKPYLTYNEPQGEYILKNLNDPILLDFYISNCTLAREAYKVRVTIDNEVIGKLYQWTPYLIYGLKPGEHTIKLELLDPSNDKVPGLFNEVERTIQIKVPR